MNGSLLAYATRRFVFLIPMLIGLSLVMFILIHLAPGDPASAMLSPQARVNADYLAQTRKNMGLDKPLPLQYLVWLKNLCTLNLGTAYSMNNQPVASLIGNRLWGTVQLQGISLTLGVLLAIPIGILSATRQYSALDNSVTFSSFVGLAIPNFWLALMLQVWLGVKLGWLPTISTGQADQPWPQRWKYFLLPLVVLTLPNIAYFVRFMRSSMLEVVKQDYMTTARAKGLSNNATLYGHAIRNAMIPMITVIGLQLPRILGGAVIIEQIFAWPGIGLLAWDAISRRDYPVILGVTMMIGAAVMVVNVLVDLVYALVDPRVTVG